MLKRIVTLFITCVVANIAFGTSAGLIQKILIQGNEHISNEAILAVMHSKEDQPLVESTLKEDEKSIFDLGFFKNVKVLSRKLEDTDYEVVVELIENPVVKNIKVEGNKEISTETILEIVEKYQSIGQVYNLKMAKPISEAISELYREKGYFAMVDIAPLAQDPTTLNIRIIQEIVEAVKIEGLVRTKKWVIERLIKTRAGEPFNAYTWDADRRMLDSTQWFESITSSAKETSEIGKMDLILNLKEQHTGQFRLGAAMPQHGGIAGAVGYSDTNFLGLGQTIAANLQYSIGGAGLGGSLDYMNPFLDSQNTQMLVRAYSKINNYFTTGAFGAVSSPTGDAKYDERRTGAGISFRRPIYPYFGVTVGVHAEHIKAINEPNHSKDFIQQNGNLAVFQAMAEMDRRDVAADPTTGDYARISLEPAFGRVSKSNGLPQIIKELNEGGYFFLRSEVEYKKFFSNKPPRNKPIDTPRPVLGLRACYGIINGKVPFFEQFFVGGTAGSNTLRGYNDMQFWGKQKFTATAEYRYPIQKNFGALAFVDIGDAWGGYPSINDFIQTKGLRMHVGYGPGIYFKSPLGPIQIAFGFNKNGQHVTHFWMGGNF